MPDPSSFAAAAARIRRPGLDAQPVPQPRARRSRMLLVVLPVFAVFAAFSAIVWLAYEHGAQGPPIGEPPLIKAPALAIKLPADEAGPPVAAEQGEVRDLLADTPPSDQLEQLLPAPEQPQAPVTAAAEPDDGAGDVAAVAPAPPQASGPATTAAPPARPATTGPAIADRTQTRPATTGPATTGPATTGPATTGPATTGPTPTGPTATSPTTTGRAANGEAVPPPVAASPPAATPAPAQVATAPAVPQRPPLAVERQSAAQNGATRPSIAPQPTPKEAEEALEALLAEVTSSSGPAPASTAPNSVRPLPAQPSPAPAATAPTTVSGLRPPARQTVPQPASPPTVSPFTRPATGDTASAPDQLATRPPAVAATTTTTPPPGSTTILEPTPGSRVAALESGYRIQLAAVRDEADARRAWDLFLVDLGPVLRGLQPFIERAETANGVFYRVQIGPFADLQEAETLCDELKRRNASCFVIRR